MQKPQNKNLDVNQRSQVSQMDLSRNQREFQVLPSSVRPWWLPRGKKGWQWKMEGTGRSAEAMLGGVVRHAGVELPISSRESQPQKTAWADCQVLKVVGTTNESTKSIDH